MKQTFNRYICSLLLGVVTLAGGAQTPELNILDISGSGTAGNIKAEVVNLGDRTITSVIARSETPYTGASVATENSFEVIDGHFISANTVIGTDTYYNLEVTLSDGTVLKTPCVNQARNSAFWWLTDFPYTATGQTGGRPVYIDCAGDTTLMFGNTEYYRGVCSMGGSVKFAIPAELDVQRLEVRLCMQQGQSGSMQHRFKVNNGGQLGFTRPASGYVDVSSATYSQYVPSLPITSVEIINSSNTNVWADFLIPRLFCTYNPVQKTAQHIEFDNKSQSINYPQEIYLSVRSFDDEGNDITKETGSYSFRVTEGADAVTLDGNRLTFLDGHDCRVSVEVVNWGGDTYGFASKVLSFDVRTGAKVFFTSVLDANMDAPEAGFINIHSQGKKLTSLHLKIYNNYFNLTEVADIDLLSAWSDIADNVDSKLQMVPFDYSLIPVDGVFRINYQFEGEEPIYGPYRERVDPVANAYDYMSDLPYTFKAGYGTVYVDRAFGGTRALQTAGVTFAKGFAIHPSGGAETFATAAWVQSNFSLSDYDRFKVRVGKQQGGTYKIRFHLHDNVSSANGTTVVNPIYNSGAIGSETALNWEYDIPEGREWIRVVSFNGGDGNADDGGSLCGPRFYHRKASRKPQSITWIETGELVNDRPYTVDLDAKSSSGNEIYYRIIKGGDVASIVNRNKLSIDVIRDEAEIVVEAYIPGDREWAPSMPVTRTYSFTQGVIAHKGELVELEGGKSYESVIVYTDGVLSGEVNVPSGVVNVKKLVIRHEMEPGNWYSVCFPSDIDLDRISNLAALGYNLGENLHVKSFNPQATATSGQDYSWDNIGKPILSGGIGYMMSIDGEGSETVEFTIDNVRLELDSSVRLFNLTLDMSQSLADTQHKVYIRSSNVRSNILAVNVDYQPTDLSHVPVNHVKALEEMRVTYAPHSAGIRLVLPDDSEARVAIYSADGKKMMRAFRYVAPNLIPTSDMRPGKYMLAVQYGNASTIVPLTIK